MWYAQRMMCIRWSNAISLYFIVYDGVKQGGILWPILFNVYMDGLSESLNSFNIGGEIENTFLHHMCYPDDLRSVSLSSVGR